MKKILHDANVLDAKDRVLKVWFIWDARMTT
jgi:hypothetical protein